MSFFVFLGPSLRREEAASLLDATYLKPVAMGDLYVLASTRARSGDHIAIVDGFFEQVPAVWHKEILFALSRGINVYGASSMGALRAAEMHGFGMRGVGRIFEAYRDGALQDDDDVAVAHGPAEYGYRPLSDSMASIRLRLDALVEKNSLPADFAQELVAKLKRVPYGERSWSYAVEQAKEAGANAEIVGMLEIAMAQPDVKAEDARELLRALAQKKTDGDCEPFRPNFVFHNTSYWVSLTRSMALRVDAVEHDNETERKDDRDVVELFRAGGPLRESVLDGALLDRLGMEAARSFVPDREALHWSARRIARRHSLTTAESLARWRAEQGINDQQWVRLLEYEARKYWLREQLSAELDGLVTMRMKAEGVFSIARDRLRAARSELSKVASDKPSPEDFGVTYDALQAWHERGVDRIEPDPESYARAYGFASLRAFLQALLTCFLADRASEKDAQAL